MPKPKGHWLPRESPIYWYLVQYAGAHTLPVSGVMPLVMYTDLLESILKDQKQTISARRNVETCIRNAFKGKRVLEIGCRDGQFLSFLSDHGAIVAGNSTGDKHTMAHIRVPKGRIVNSLAENIGKKTPLVDFKPDFIVSLNLFDSHRWTETTIPARRLMWSLDKIITPTTRVYVQPSVDTRSTLHFQQLQRLKRIKNLSFLQHHADGFRRDRQAEMFRFGWRKRRTQKKKI